MQNKDIKGLTSLEAKKLYDEGKRNYSVTPPSKTKKEIVHDNVFTYFNFVFFIIAILLILVGSFRDLTFLPVIIANTLIGIFQEIKAKKVLDELTMLNTPRANVVRDGTELSIPTENLVLGDTVIFRAGNQIPADAKIISGNVAVNESLLTGEADEISKTVDDELLSGSFIVSGSCYAILTKVGRDSYINKLTLQAKQIKTEEQSEIIKSLNKIVKIAGIVIIPIGITLFCQQYLIYHETIKVSIQAMVASVIGMIPEGLFLLSSVTLALSAMRLAKKKVLLHDMKSIETLARVNVLCIDKTGTITDGTMQVEKYVTLNNHKDTEVKELLCDFAFYQEEDNITMKALKDYFKDFAKRKLKNVVGFSSEFKYSGVNFENETFVIGAPEFLLKDNYSKYQKNIEEYSTKGYRVLVFGSYPDAVSGGALTKSINPYGLVILFNPIRENAKETFKYFAEQGVQIKVISGDNPVTVKEVAKQAGILNADSYIDASTLKTDSEIENAILNYAVFGRVTPEQKRKFVKYLQKNGKTVAMTGDGVNDVLALKDADCSVAMASGSDAAMQASQVVLLESDFSRMPEVVLEGRRVVNNLERSGSLFLVKNIFSFLTSILAIYFGIKYPLEPAQVSLISMFTIGIPAFFLAQIPNEDIISGKFIRNIIFAAIPGGLTDTIMVALMVSYGMVFGVDSTDISTASTILLAIIGLMVLYNISRPMDKVKWLIWSGCALGLILSIIYLKSYFGITENMSLQGVLLCANFAIMTRVFLNYVTMGANYLKGLYQKVRDKFTKKEVEVL